MPSGVPLTRVRAWQSLWETTKREVYGEAPTSANSRAFAPRLERWRCDIFWDLAGSIFSWPTHAAGRTFPRGAGRVPRRCARRRTTSWWRQGLKLDLTRGKPATAQLDLSDELLNLPEDVVDQAGVDTRNYGGLEGIAELRAMFADLLWVEPEQVVAGGSSSLVMMREVLTDLWLKGGVDSERPVGPGGEGPFICPVPGYDRHFTLLDWFGIEMVTVPMNDDGPAPGRGGRAGRQGPVASRASGWCRPTPTRPARS